MFIGTSPDEAGNRTGYPYSGKSSRILSQIFRYAEPCQYLLTTSVACRTCDVVFMTDELADEFWDSEQKLDLTNPDYHVDNWGRNPTEKEMELCRYRLEELEKAYKPHGIVYLGRVAQAYKTRLPTLLLREPAWIDDLDYKLLPVRQEADKLSQFVKELSSTLTKE